jgi:dTDP-4-dehydrorhamnose reductase
VLYSEFCNAYEEKINKEMKIGIVGASGKLGKVLIGNGCVPLSCDITDQTSIKRVLASEKPDIVVNLASHPDPENNYTQALDVNVFGFRDLCDITFFMKIPVVALSTDHIYSGKTYFDWRLKKLIRAGPYSEDYPYPVPVNFYGITKLGMETVACAYDNVKVVRTSYCFDADRLCTEIDSLRKGQVVECSEVICRSFLHTHHFADNFIRYLERFFEMPTILHISGSITVSWYKLIKSLASIYGFDESLVKSYINRDNLFSPRPKKGGLVVQKSKQLGLPQFSYLDGLKLMRNYENVSGNTVF